MKDQLQKAMDIARRTGDRLIIYDTARTNDTYVVMSLEEYEKVVKNKLDSKRIADLTEEELLDKINRDIAAWKNEQSEKDVKAEKLSDFRKYYKKIIGSDGFEDEDTFAPYNDMSELEEYDIDDKSDEYEENDFRFSGQEWGYEDDKRANNPWNIPQDRKKAAEEIIEEDNQYLEEI